MLLATYERAVEKRKLAEKGRKDISTENEQAETSNSLNCRKRRFAICNILSLKCSQHNRINFCLKLVYTLVVILLLMGYWMMID